MAATVFIYPKLNLLHSQYSGVVTGVDLRENMKSIQQHPEFRPGLIRLVDLSAVRAFDYNVSEAVTLSEEVGQHYRDDERIRCAYLAPSSLAFGMARMFESLLSQHTRMDIGVFRTEDGARQFLEVFDPIPSIEVGSTQERLAPSGSS